MRGAVAVGVPLHQHNVTIPYKTVETAVPLIQRPIHRMNHIWPAAQPKILQELEQENGRLKRLVAAQALDNAILKEAAKPNS